MEEISARESMQIYASVSNHLLYNFYPPAKHSYISPAYKAVLACRQGEPDTPIEIPDGFSVRAVELVQYFRMDCYLPVEWEE